MWCGAEMAAFELAVALVDDTAVFAIGVPNLRTKITPAVSADDFRGVNTGATVWFDASFLEL